MDDATHRPYLENLEVAETTFRRLNAAEILKDVYQGAEVWFTTKKAAAKLKLLYPTLSGCLTTSNSDVPWRILRTAMQTPFTLAPSRPPHVPEGYNIRAVENQD